MDNVRGVMVSPTGEICSLTAIESCRTTDNGATGTRTGRQSNALRSSRAEFRRRRQIRDAGRQHRAYRVGGTAGIKAGNA
jgi:hypothetical protein